MSELHSAKVSRRKNERGGVLAYSVISFLFLFFAVGLGVDLSHLYSVKTELQNTADSAALAGASALTDPNPTRIATAVDRALQIMNSNRYNFDKKNYVDVMSLAAQRSLVQFAINLAGPYVDEGTATNDPRVNDFRFVRVRTPSVPVNMFFSVLLLGATQSLDATATSGLSVPGNVNFCPAPLSAVECNPGADCASDFWGTCPATVDPHGIQADGCNPKRQFCKGCSYVIRSDGGSGPSAGNYQVLACAGSGANEVRDALAAYGTNCSCGSISPTQTILTEPGVNAGPIAQGLNVRFDDYTGGAPPYSTSVPPDTNIAQGTPSGTGANTTWPGINWAQYTAGNPFVGPAAGHVGVVNRRVLVIPIIPESEFANGRTNVRVSSLGGFFMQTQAMGTNGDIKVEYIGDDVVGVIGFDPNGGNTTNIVTPVLYR